jgi:hypothetical protein
MSVQVQQNFGSHKTKLLSQYRFAFEQALAKANFLNTSDMVVLQALVLFLILARRHDDTRFCWTMTGLVIRIAQGIGIHRDGTHFNLPPFETEMRRRLWWAICTLDLRSAEELGTDLTIVSRSFDTELPSNIDDADISPESLVPPKPKLGQSDCAVALIRCEICALSRRLYTVSSAMANICPKDAASTFEEREKMLIEVYDKVEDKFIRHFLGDHDALFWMAAMIARVIMAKMCLVIYQPLLFPGTGPELANEIRDRLFVSAIEIVEYNHMLNTDERCRQWRWLFQTYTQWHAIAYLLMEISRRQWSATVERAWEALNGTLNTRHQIELARMANHTAVWMPLRRLFMKARKHREAEILRLRADPEAARRVDFEDRLNPSSARFGPVPGTEQQLAQTRERWRNMMSPDAANPLAELPALPLGGGRWTGAASVGKQSVSVPPATGASFAAGTPNTAPGTNPNVLDFTNSVVMDSSSFNVVDLWSFVYDGDPAGPNNPGPETTTQTSQTTPSPKPPTSTNMYGALRPQGVSFQVPPSRGQQTGVRSQQAPAPAPPAVSVAAAPVKDDNPPPWLWSDPFTVMNTKFDDIPTPAGDAADENMDVDGEEEDFDWRNWQESMKSFEMDSSGGVLPTKAAW